VECIVDNNNEDDRYFNYITISNGGGFAETPMKVKNQNINLAQNYNDDLPHNEVVDFLKGDKSGLILLHGIPGTGKTSYIRHLMYEIKNRKFLVLDSAIFNYINNSSFVNLLLNNKNSIIILEDCEDMLADRIAGNNHLTTLLNLSDGIIGDSFNFKFICTFNANITKIDKAILRKGRMRLKYEFKALCADKTKKLAESLNRSINEGESLTLADIYNYNLNNGGETIKNAKIGFAQ
jgi:ATP-dependent 26S proteasome regulatory subunit